MTHNWQNQAEFIATVVDARGEFQWLVELGAGRQVVASIAPSLRVELQALAPGDFVRLKFRIANKSPRILGYSDMDRSGGPTGSLR